MSFGILLAVVGLSEASRTRFILAANSLPVMFDSWYFGHISLIASRPRIGESISTK